MKRARRYLTDDERKLFESDFSRVLETERAAMRRPDHLKYLEEVLAAFNDDGR
jgi:hypothetical protein